MMPDLEEDKLDGDIPNEEDIDVDDATDDEDDDEESDDVDDDEET